MHAIQLPLAEPLLRWPRALGLGRPVRPFCESAARTAALLRAAAERHTPRHGLLAPPVNPPPVLLSAPLALPDAGGDAARAGAAGDTGPLVATRDPAVRVADSEAPAARPETADAARRQDVGGTGFVAASAEEHMAERRQGARDGSASLEGGMAAAADAASQVVARHAPQTPSDARADALAAVAAAVHSAVGRFTGGVHSGREALAIVTPTRLIVLAAEGCAGGDGASAAAAWRRPGHAPATLLDAPHALLATVRAHSDARTLCLTYAAPSVARYGQQVLGAPALQPPRSGTDDARSSQADDPPQRAAAPARSRDASDSGVPESCSTASRVPAAAEKRPGMTDGGAGAAPETGVVTLRPAPAADDCSHGGGHGGGGFAGAMPHVVLTFREDGALERLSASLRGRQGLEAIVRQCRGYAALTCGGGGAAPAANAP